MKFQLEKMDRAALRDAVLQANPDLINDPEALSEVIDVFTWFGKHGRWLQRKGFVQGAICGVVGLATVAGLYTHRMEKNEKTTDEKK